MRKTISIMAAGAVSILLFNGCGPSEQAGSDSSQFGECKVTSEPDSIEFQMQTPGTLTVAAVLPSPGWYNGPTAETIDSGFEYCMAAEIATMAGADNLQIKNLAWDQYISGSSNNYDIAIAGTTITDERKAIFDFSVPYFESNLGIVVMDGANVTEENLTAQNIGVLQGNVGAMYVQDSLGVQPQLFQSQPDMFTALQSGQIDAVVTDTTLALTATKSSQGELAVVGQIKMDQGYGVVTPKGSSNSSPVNEAVEVLQQKGTLDRLSDEWLSPFFGVDPNSVPFWEVK